MSVVMAIGKEEPLLFKVYSGSLDHIKYQAFIDELSEKLPARPYFLIQDNARIHMNTSSIHTMVNLPPYSPFLYPIEVFFSKLKIDVRTRVKNHPDMLSSNHNQRQSILQQIIETVAAKQEYKDLRSYYRHCRKFLPDCLCKLDIFGD